MHRLETEGEGEGKGAAFPPVAFAFARTGGRLITSLPVAAAVTFDPQRSCPCRATLDWAGWLGCAVASCRLLWAIDAPGFSMYKEP